MRRLQISRLCTVRTGQIVDLELPRSLLVLQRQAEAFARNVSADRPIREDSWIIGYDREVSLELGRRGWLGMTWPTRYGGHDRSPLERLVVAEMLISYGAPIAATWFSDRQMGPSILSFGTEDQKLRYLPDMARGETNWCIGMSEPDHGSDLAHLQTRADRLGNHYVVSGSKVWTSFASTADYMYLICRTNHEAPTHRGLSELIVDMKSPGIAVSSIADMTGNRHFCSVHFDDVLVPIENLVGSEDRAWQQTVRQLEHERGGIDRWASNRGLFLESVDLADKRSPLVRQEIAQLETQYRIGRLLVIRQVLGQGVDGFSSATKVAGTEYEQEVASFASSVIGPEATLQNRWSRALCYSPAYTIMGGTSNVLRSALAERVLGLPR
jgi:alkylation response protein AidB-like acyl-CoA dehydrogenase